MTRWVSLATDANSQYAIYAPIVTRIWQHLGYKPILFMHSQGWETDFGRFVRDHLPDSIPLIDVPRLDPLSVANTMRTIRLAACACSFIGSNDLILTSDIDMAPIDRSWFNRDGSSAFVLRADAYGPFDGSSTLLPGEGRGRACQAGLFRLPMCYVGLERDIWRDVTPYRAVMEGDPVALGRAILHGCRADDVYYDETFCSARLLLSRWAVGQLEAGALPADRRQGALELIGMTEWPGNWPLGMQIGGVVARPDSAHPIDFHMPKPTNLATGESLAAYWPEERDFLSRYWTQAMSLAGFQVR